MKKKMSFQDLRSMFVDPLAIPDTSDPDVISGATKPNHKHKHNPSKKPSRGRITPAQYRRRKKNK